MYGIIKCMTNQLTQVKCMADFRVGTAHAVDLTSGDPDVTSYIAYFAYDGMRLITLVVSNKQNYWWLTYAVRI